ncbi:MAG: TetR/AcrR family transcriptional regulator [Balneolaceae bacterium]
MPRKKNYSPDTVEEKAMMLFWKNGYKATSVRMLEEEMGINQFSIYSSFDSKMNLFIQSLRRYRQNVRKGFLKILIESDGSIEDIRLFMNRFVDSVRTGNTPAGCLIANTATEFGNTNELVKKELNEYYNMLEDLFLTVLERAREKKEIKKNSDIKKSAKFLVTSTQGMAVTAKVLKDDDLRAFIDKVIEAVK